ncbi:hypothetical protein LCGC14_3093640, partial [marine sediment metagenome]
MSYKAKYQLAIELKKASEELQNVAMDEELKDLGCDTLDWIKHFKWNITCSDSGWYYTGTPRDDQGVLIRDTLNAQGSSDWFNMSRAYTKKFTARLQALGYDNGHGASNVHTITLHFFGEEQAAKLIRESQMQIENAEELVSTLK